MSQISQITHSKTKPIFCSLHITLIVKLNKNSVLSNYLVLKHAVIHCVSSLFQGAKARLAGSALRLHYRRVAPYSRLGTN